MLKSIVIAGLSLFATVPTWSQTLQPQIESVNTWEEDEIVSTDGDQTAVKRYRNRQTASKQQSDKAYKIHNQLKVYPLFEKFKRNPSCKLTVIENGYSNFIELTTSSREVTEEISRAVEEDLKDAGNKVINYTQNSDEIVASFGNCTLIFNKRTNGKSSTVSLSWQNSEK